MKLRRPRSPAGQVADVATQSAEPAPIDVPATPPLLCWPLDHYYSPVPDNAALAREPSHSRVFPAVPRATPGIDWRALQQVAFLRELGPSFPIEFADHATGDPRDYYPDNGMFARLDAWMLQAMLRHFRPRRMIETGCGWSSLVTARVNREYLNGSLEFTCVEPHPPEFLGEGIEGISQLIVSRVEELPLDPFLELESGDVLFIDTSHVAKTGGDVVFLFQEVLPRLASGVVVHIHDIFLPWDYPEEWVMTGRSWNEQYLVRAFLSFNSAFEILLSVAWMRQYGRAALTESVADYPELFLPGGGSLWIRRI